MNQTKQLERKLADIKYAAHMLIALLSLGLAVIMVDIGYHEVAVVYAAATAWGIAGAGRLVFRPFKSARRLLRGEN